MPEAMTEQHDLRRLLKTLRASIWLILLLVVVAGAGAYAVSLATPARYRSAETLIYLPAGGTVDVTTDTATRDLQTAVGLVQAAPVLAPSAKRLGVTQDELRASVSGVLPANSNLLRIEATAATAAGAQNRAVTVAKVFQQFRLGLQRRAIDARINAIKTQIQKLSPAANSDAAAQIRSLRDQFSLSVSDRAVANGDFVIGDPARLPTAAFQPQPTRNAVLGAVAGLLIGIAAAFGRARLNRRLNTVAGQSSRPTACRRSARSRLPASTSRTARAISSATSRAPPRSSRRFRSTRATLSLFRVGTNVQARRDRSPRRTAAKARRRRCQPRARDGDERQARARDLRRSAQAVPLRLLPRSPRARACWTS